jgi:hypothetical protein
MILDPVAAFRQRTAAIAPITRAEVAAAIALVPRQARDGLGLPYGFQHTNQSSRLYERERWYLSISPGTVRVHSRTMAPKVSLWDDVGVTVTDAPVRGAIDDFSAKSRARMFSTLPSLDYGPMFATGNPSAMVTLTLPGQGWEQLVPDLRTFKKLLDRFQLEYSRAWGARPVAVWKMEFQRRGAPHVHLFMVPPTGTARGRGVARTFPNWLSITWAKIVGAPAGSQARFDHELAGTGIDYVEGQRFSDPRRIAAYFSKHGVYADKEYQNWMPEHWRAAILEGRSGGARFWGYWQLEKAVETVELRSGVSRKLVTGEPVMRHHEPRRRGIEFDSNDRPHYVSLRTSTVPRGDLRTLDVVAQRADHALQDPEGTSLVVRCQTGQHPQLDGPDRNARLLEAPSTAWREPRGKNFPNGGLPRPGHVAVPFQGLQ